MNDKNDFMTAGQISVELAEPYWKVDRTLSRGFFTDVVRVGAYRAIRRSDLSRFRDAMRQAGYLKELVEA